MNRTLITIGNIHIYWYSIFILLAVIIGYLITIKEVKKRNIDKNKWSDLIFYILLYSFIGARLYYVIFNISYYTKYPLEVLMVWEGGLAIHGGIIVGIIATIYYSRKLGKTPLEILDILSPALIIGQAIGRWGNFFNQEAHGPITTLTNLKQMHLPNFIIEGMNINGSYYIPTFLYESVLCIIGFLIMIIIRKKLKLKTGTMTGMYFIIYGIIRYIIESMRTDSLMLFSLKQAQIISLIMVILGVLLLIIKRGDKNERI